MKTKTDSIPIPRKKVKTGRVGIGNERAKKITVNNKSDTPVLIEEIVAINDDSCFDVPMETIEIIDSSSDESSSLEESSIEIIADADHDDNTNQLHLFPKIVAKLSTIDYRKNILQNGCHSLTYIDLLSLEPSLTNMEQKGICEIDQGFKVGWLHNEILNSYFHNITKERHDVLYIGSTIATSIGHGQSFRKL